VFPPTQIATKILIALGIGLLVGLEREWAHKDVGLRTFSLTALLGMLSSLQEPIFAAISLIGVLLLVGFLNLRSVLADRSLEITTSVAWVAACFDTTALYAIGVTVFFRSRIRDKKQFPFLQHPDALVNLRPVRFVRWRLHREFRASRIARLGHIIWRCDLFHIDRMSKSGRSQPIASFAEGTQPGNYELWSFPGYD
jgi:hypothetical protein